MRLRRQASNTTSRRPTATTRPVPGSRAYGQCHDSVESRQNAAAPSTPKTIRVVGRRLSSTPAEGDVHWHRIYRGSSAEFQPGPENFLTYVPKEVTESEDNGPGFDLGSR